MTFPKIYKSLLFLFTIFLLFLFIWLRFIKERLPFIIPYELSILSSLVLIGIISFYIYIIFSQTISPLQLNPMFSKLISYFYKPFIELDSALKYNLHILPYYEKLLRRIVLGIKIFNKSYNFTHPRIYTYLALIMQILPRVVIIGALLIDIFFLQSFFLTYKAIYFSIILLLNQYIVYSLYDAKEYFLKKLENICDYISSDYKDPNDESEISLYCLSKLEPRIFMEIQTQAMYIDQCIIILWLRQIGSIFNLF